MEVYNHGSSPFSRFLGHAVTLRVNFQQPQLYLSHSCASEC